MNPTTIFILNILVPTLSGAFFALLGLTKKYNTRLKYACLSPLTWIYILVSAGGSLLFTLLIEAIGTRVVTDSILNIIILGLIGPGLFLGIISKFSVSESSLPISGSSAHNADKQAIMNNDVNKHIITLRDYIYEILDTSILRKTTQKVELKIMKAGAKIDPEILLREAKGILGSITSLNDNQKKDLEEKFGEWATRGDYASIIRELIQHYDVDHIIARLSYSAARLPSNLKELVQITLVDLDQDPELWEFMSARVRALQREPDAALHYLEIAINKDSSLKERLQKNFFDLRPFLGMTRGESQLDRLNKLKDLIEFDEIDPKEVEDLIDIGQKDPNHLLLLTGVRRTNGDCVTIRLEKVGTSPIIHNSKWCFIEDDKRPGKTFTNLNLLVEHIKKCADHLILLDNDKGNIAQIKRNFKNETAK